MNFVRLCEVVVLCSLCKEALSAGWTLLDAQLPDPQSHLCPAYDAVSRSIYLIGGQINWQVLRVDVARLEAGDAVFEDLTGGFPEPQLRHVVCGSDSSVSLTARRTFVHVQSRGLWFFDMAAQSFEMRVASGDIPTSSVCVSATEDERYLVLVGLSDDAVFFLLDLEAPDLEWVQGPTPNIKKYSPGCVVGGSYFYTSSGTGTQPDITDHVERIRVDDVNGLINGLYQWEFVAPEDDDDEPEASVLDLRAAYDHVERRVYFVGGMVHDRGLDHVEETWVVETETREVHDGPKMKEERHLFALQVAPIAGDDSRLAMYAFGGRNDAGDLDSIEFLELEEVVITPAPAIGDGKKDYKPFYRFESSWSDSLIRHRGWSSESSSSSKKDRKFQHYWEGGYR